jgi:hypothetical protein
VAWRRFIVSQRGIWGCERRIEAISPLIREDLKTESPETPSRQGPQSECSRKVWLTRTTSTRRRGLYLTEISESHRGSSKAGEGGGRESRDD